MKKLAVNERLMIEIIKFIGQDPEHFFGAFAILLVCFGGMALIVVSIGYAIMLARGFDTGGDDDNADTKQVD